MTRKPTIAAVRQNNPMKTPTYKCPELQRPPGIPDERFEAFNLPSLMNGVRVYPKRKV